MQEINDLSIPELLNKINEAIIVEIENNCVPWARPWGIADSPQNPISKELYDGLNCLYLASRGHFSNNFLTKEQILELGGFIVENSPGYPVVFGEWLDGDIYRFDLRKPIVVYNCNCCENLPQDIFEKPKQMIIVNMSIEKILDEMPERPKIVYGGWDAFYVENRDTIYMPLSRTYANMDSYCSAFCNLLIQCTVHEKRLRLFQPGAIEFDIDRAVNQEFIGALGSWQIQSRLGMFPKYEFDKKFFDTWSKRLKEFPLLYIHSSLKAQKAVNYILGLETEANPKKAEVYDDLEFLKSIH